MTRWDARIFADSRENSGLSANGAHPFGTGHLPTALVFLTMSLSARFLRSDAGQHLETPAFEGLLAIADQATYVFTHKCELEQVDLVPFDLEL